MPYAIRKQGDKYALVKKDTGEKVSMHDSRASAMGQMKAIYANEGAAAKKDMMGGMYGDSMMTNSVPIAFMAQDDPRVNYDPLGGNKTYACANCEFFNARSSSCQLICGDIVPTGYCDLWTRELTPQEREADRAIPMYMVEKSLVARIKEAVQDALGLLKPEDQFANIANMGKGIKTFGPDNRYWVAFWSNNARDRDGEWFAEKAHDQYIDRVANGIVPYPELWYWHEPQLKSGKAFYIDRVGHCVFAVGEFDDTPVGQHMKAYFAKGTDDGVSHGYLYPRVMRVNGVYHDYNTFEISPLPEPVASNPFTTFVSAQEINEMALSAEKRKALESRLGTDFVNQLYATGETKSKAMEQIATDFKGSDVNPLEASVKALESKFDLLLEAIAGSKAFPPKKKGAEGSDEEEATESDSEAAAEGDKPKKKKEASPAPAPATDPGLVTVLTRLNDTMIKQGQALALLTNDMKAVKEQFANPISATRSQFTVVPPGDPAIAALAAKMTGQGGDPTLAPGTAQQPQDNIADMSTIFGGTQIYQALNGNHP